MSIKEIIDSIIVAEGGYTDDKNDAGGETNFGITVAVARANGYAGPMRDMPRDTAVRIYEKRYWHDPGFDLIEPLSSKVALELTDTGVNMGPETAAKWFQIALNVFNRAHQLYGDIAADGKIGPGTAAAFQAYLAKRGNHGESVMLKALNCLQGARYIELAGAREASETFVFGWIDNRVAL